MDPRDQLLVIHILPLQNVLLHTTDQKERANRIYVTGFYGHHRTAHPESQSPRLLCSQPPILVWENTVIVKALILSEAHDKVTSIGNEHTAPYKGGLEGIDVQWQFEGVIELLPVYEEPEDGGELM